MLQEIGGQAARLLEATVGEFPAVTPRDLVGVAGVPAIVGLVEMVKWVLPEVPARTYPLFALAFGVGINLALMGYSGAGAVEAVALGVVAALMASGLYSQTKVLKTPSVQGVRRQGVQHERGKE